MKSARTNVFIGGVKQGSKIIQYSTVENYTVSGSFPQYFLKDCVRKSFHYYFYTRNFLYELLYFLECLQLLPKSLSSKISVLLF